MGTDFFTRWRFFTDPDPTRGAVNYVSYDMAVAAGLVQATPERVYIGADRTTQQPNGEGRRSVRLESLATYNEGLFVIRLDHLPVGCGTWPALWMFGEDASHPWPVWGEYDIIEGVHKCTQVTTSLHTTSGCDQSSVTGVEWKQGLSPEFNADNCDIHAPNQFENQGCNQLGPQNSMGLGFNSMGGGTFAAEWDPKQGKQIRTWFWSAGMEPPGLSQNTVNPDEWGAPFSRFTLDDQACHASHFANMRLVIDLTFCGDLGSPTFSEPYGCPAIANAMSCEDFVNNHPGEFADAYWSIRGLDMYAAVAEQSGGAAAPGWAKLLLAAAAAYAAVLVLALCCLCRAAR